MCVPNGSSGGAAERDQGYGPMGYCPAIYGRPMVSLPRCRWTGCQRTATALNAKYCGPHAKESHRRSKAKSERRRRQTVDKVLSENISFIVLAKWGGSIQMQEGGEAPDRLPQGRPGVLA